MERRYLATTVALVATFVIFSNAFRQENVTRVMQSRNRLVSELNCATRTIETAVAANLPSVLRPGSPEKAQMLAEMSVPAAVAQMKADEVQAKLDEARAKLDAARAKLEEKRAEMEAAQARLQERAAAPVPPVSPRIPSIVIMAPSPVSAVSATPATPQAPMAMAETNCEHAAHAAERAQRAIERSKERMLREHEKMTISSMRNLHEVIRVQMNLPEGFNQTAYSFTLPNAKALQQQIKIKVLRDGQMQLYKQFGNL